MTFLHESFEFRFVIAHIRPTVTRYQIVTCSSNKLGKIAENYLLILFSQEEWDTNEWTNQVQNNGVKGVLHLWALFLKTLCIFSENKAISDKVSYGSGQKCSKKLKNDSFTSVETIVVKLQWKMC